MDFYNIPFNSIYIALFENQYWNCVLNDQFLTSSII
jgi:hypothetical protein